MAEKLAAAEGRAVYVQRKHLVEVVNGVWSACLSTSGV